MDENLGFVIEKRMEKTIENLHKNNMTGYFVQDRKEALEKVKELLNTGDTVGVGGSVTLNDIGALDLLRNGDYNFLDRYAEGLTPEEEHEIFLKSFAADAYITSSNAIIEEGALYNVDGRGNRVAAMLYGPKKVIVVVGYNKIVSDIGEAIERTATIAAPGNNKRLSTKNPCVKTGLCSDCTSPTRICNEYTLIRRQAKPDRMHVIIVKETLGY